MQKREYITELDAPVEAVWEFHNRLDVLPAITPPQTKVWLKNAPEFLAEGVHFTLIVSQPPIYIPMPWETYITAYEPPTLFIDEQGIGPFKYWRHEHHFEPLPNNRTRLRDLITYEVPLGPLGIFADRLFIRQRLESMFAYRHTDIHQKLNRVAGLI